MKSRPDASVKRNGGGTGWETRVTGSPEKNYGQPRRNKQQAGANLSL